jgi:hypothetical protein
MISKYNPLIIHALETSLRELMERSPQKLSIRMSLATIQLAMLRLLSWIPKDNKFGPHGASMELLSMPMKDLLCTFVSVTSGVAMK